jgi:hypothetical protein
MKMRKKGYWIAVMGLAFFAAVTALLMLLWNALVPDIFGLNDINFWQAAGLIVLTKLLFCCSWGRGGHWHHKRMHDFHHHHNSLHRKWMKMSPEEREEFIQKRRHHHHDFCRSDFAHSHEDDCCKNDQYGCRKNDDCRKKDEDKK